MAVVTCFSRIHVHSGSGGPSRARLGGLQSLGKGCWRWGRSLLLQRERPLRGLRAEPEPTGTPAGGGPCPRRGSPPGHRERLDPGLPPPPARSCPPSGSSFHPRRSATIVKGKKRTQWQEPDSIRNQDLTASEAPAQVRSGAESLLADRQAGGHATAGPTGPPGPTRQDAPICSCRLASKLLSSSSQAANERTRTRCSEHKNHQNHPEDVALSATSPTHRGRHACATRAPAGGRATEPGSGCRAGRAAALQSGKLRHPGTGARQCAGGPRARH